MSTVSYKNNRTIQLYTSEITYSQTISI